MKNSNTPTPTASIDPPHADTAPVVKHQVELDEVDLLISAPRRYFASPEDERDYYVIKDQQETITASLGWDATYEAKVSGTQFAQSLSSTPQPVAIPMVANTAPAQAPVPVVSNTQPSPVPTASTKNPIVTLAWCNAWLQFTYVHELAELVALGVYVQARAVRAPGEVFGPSTLVLLTVKDGLAGGEAGLDGELTFTFWDTDYPKVELGSLTMSQFRSMAHRFWQDLPMVVSVYQARAEYIAATGASPAENMPDVEARVGYKEYNWFTGDTPPKHEDGCCQYSRQKFVEMENVYAEWAHDGF